MTDYRWLAESVVMCGDTITLDILNAIEHAQDVPGDTLTPARVDRLGKLRAEIETMTGQTKETRDNA